MSDTNLPQLSYWEKEQYFQQIDVLIIGSGIVGLNAAISIKQASPNLKVQVWERGPLPAGASTRNAGFACFGSLTEIIEDLQKHSEEEVFSLLEKRWQGLARLRALLGDTAMEYREWGGYELFRAGEEQTYQECQDQMSRLNQQIGKIIGKKNIYQNADSQIKSFALEGVQHLIVNRAEGQINTGKMMQALLQKARDVGVEIINGLGVKTLESNAQCVRVLGQNGWEVWAQKVLVATNGFARDLLPELQVQAARNQVLITSEIPNLKIQGCFHYERGYYYFRNINSRILLGGGRNLAPELEQTNRFGTSSLIRKALLDLLEKVILPGQEIIVEQWWSGILGIGEQKTPIVREVQPNVVVAARLGGMGIAIGSLIGEEGAALLLK